MSPDEIRAKLRAFVTKNFYMADPDAFTDQTSFLDQGIIDSTGVLELILFLEQRFGVRVADAEATPRNLDSVARIAAFVATKLRSPAPTIS